MQNAYQSARASFRYFWRELSWERRRIVPALDLAIVKLPFTDGPRTDGNAEFEQMWIGDVDFDGDSVQGTLMNAPNWLTSVREGETVTAPWERLTDWMMTVNGRAYGGFTVNLMRARMSRRERDEHDQAWGLEFGDPNDVQVEIVAGAKPKTGLLGSLFGQGSRQQTTSGFRDHPMCVNMLPTIDKQLKADRSITLSVGDNGWTLLHQEAIAGNLGIVKLLLAHGADATARTPNGYTAAELAHKIGWPEIADTINGSAG